MKIINYFASWWKEFHEKKRQKKSLRQQQKALENLKKMKKSVASYCHIMQEKLEEFEKVKGKSNSYRLAVGFYRLSLGITHNILLKEDAIRFFGKLLEEPIAEQEVFAYRLNKYINGVQMWNAEHIFGRDVWFYRGYYVTIGYRLTSCSYGYIHPSIFNINPACSGVLEVKSYETGFAYSLHGHHFYLMYDIWHNNLRVTGLERYISLAGGEREELENYRDRQVTLEELNHDIDAY